MADVIDHVSHAQNKSIWEEGAGIWVMTINLHCWWRL